MRDENCAIWNRQHFFCGAFDMQTLKVVEVHKYEECEAVDFNSYWAFNKIVDSTKAEEMFENFIWIFFWVEKDGSIELQVEAEDNNITQMKVIQYEGIKSLIRKQIRFNTPLIQKYQKK